MWFEQLPRDLQIRFALAVAEKKAELGLDASFDRSWFFDTNCISELVKLYKGGFAREVQSFIAARDVLLTGSVVQELRKAPGLITHLETALKGANVILVPDVTKFWLTDIANFLNVDGFKINTLEAYPLLPGFLPPLIRNEGFLTACRAAENKVRSRFFSQIEDDIGSNLDERELCVHIWWHVREHGKEWFDIEIPPADATPRNFPSFYAFYYTYYFRYMKTSQVKPELGDFLDLLNCMAVPYCERFYGERKFTNILRGYVQGREPPSVLQIVKHMKRKGFAHPDAYQDARRKRTRLGVKYKLLPRVSIFNFSEMRDHIICASNESVDTNYNASLPRIGPE